MRNIVLLGVVAVAAWSSHASAAFPPALKVRDNGRYPVTAQGAFPGDTWQRATPESQGVNSAKLQNAVDYMDQQFGPDGAKELVIIRNGYLIWEGPQADAYHPIWSCTKTSTSTVLGLLIDDGRCTLDTRAVEREVHLADHFPLYSRIKLRHLASMCGGYQGEVKDVREDQPWGEPMAFLNPRAPYFEAGTTVQYNDHDVFQQPLSQLHQRPRLSHSHMAIRCGIVFSRFTRCRVAQNSHRMSTAENGMGCNCGGWPSAGNVATYSSPTCSRSQAR